MLLAVPTVNAIQRTTLILTAVTALALFVFVSAATAVSSVIGAAVMIVNFYLLALAGKFLLATARNHGGPSAAGVLLPPLKLFFIIAVVYLIAASGRVSIPGFLAGVLTQFAAIFIESWRASARPVPGISGARGV
jgi:ATP synthase I chain